MQNKITKIRAGSSFYDVKYVKDLKSEYGTPLLGRIYVDDGKIQIDDEFPMLTQLKALHHEGTHGISYEYDFGWNEKKVRIFSKAFLTFIIDNPEFIRQILKYAGRMKK